MRQSSGPNLRSPNLRNLVARAYAAAGFIADARIRLPLASVAAGSILEGGAERLRGRSVMIATTSQIAAVRAAIELDGIAARLVLCPADLSPAQRLAVCRLARIDAVLCEDPATVADLAQAPDIVTCVPQPAASIPEDRAAETEWVLLTSGTTGPPKLAVHDLAGLIAPFGTGLATSPIVWSTFYDIRRYGGLQILLRALVGGASMVLSEAGEPVGRFLARAGRAGVTHISGTPSHWRAVLMSAAASSLDPAIVRLSGEVCDQAILDRLAQAYPRAGIGHAFASTEAGVGFEVNDGGAGFPAALVEQQDAPVALRVRDGGLQIRSARTARHYLGGGSLALPDGFVDTGDLVERHGDRYVFVGRRGGIINVGGQKVHPKAVEAVINLHPDVHASRVSSWPSPITGALVVAEIVIAPGAAGIDFAAREDAILELCRRHLPAHQVPAMIRQTASLELSAAGKLSRTHA
ncbi:AMP-binding protein [Lichenicoccus sp.]|uniref:AMP-binding protein n=1 Tax=Lichenicoccus sp. TaxID=2781899 RepID=UPI003D0DB777